MTEPSETLPEAVPESDTLRLVEALLFASAEPVTRDALARHVPEDTDLDALLDRLQSDYEGRGIALVRVGKRWAFRTAEDLAGRLKIETESQRKLSRAAIETLAIIAYHQPVTRGEIEEIRGVALSKGTLDTLLEASWVGPKGRRRTPGRPVTWGTTDAFLDHFGLENLDALPGLAELKAAGLLDTRPAIAALNASGRLSELAAEEAGASEEAEGECLQRPWRLISARTWCPTTRLKRSRPRTQRGAPERSLRPGRPRTPAGCIHAQITRSLRFAGVGRFSALRASTCWSFHGRLDPGAGEPRLWRGRGGARRQPGPGARRIGVPARALRLRQDDRPAPKRRPGGAAEGPGAD
jgi:segregation and condensation protein B